jgi:hypothetical protein
MSDDENNNSIVIECLNKVLVYYFICVMYTRSTDGGM